MIATSLAAIGAVKSINRIKERADSFDGSPDQEMWRKLEGGKQAGAGNLQQIPRTQILLLAWMVVLHVCRFQIEFIETHGSFTYYILLFANLLTESLFQTAVSVALVEENYEF